MANDHEKKLMEIRRGFLHRRIESIENRSYLLGRQDLERESDSMRLDRIRAEVLRFREREVREKRTSVVTADKIQAGAITADNLRIPTDKIESGKIVDYYDKRAMTHSKPREDDHVEDLGPITNPWEVERQRWQAMADHEWEFDLDMWLRGRSDDVRSEFLRRRRENDIALKMELVKRYD